MSTVSYNSRQALLYGTLTLWLLIGGVSLAVQAGGVVNAWLFDRQAIGRGQYWRLLSAHLVHLDWPHWGLNMAGLAVVAVFFSRYGRPLQWVWVLLLSALFTGLGLYWLDPQMARYVGLSGVLHGLFIFGALHERRQHPASGYALLVLLCAKLAWENLYGPLPGSATLTGGHIMTSAHLYGALGGLAAYLVTRYFGPSKPLIRINSRKRK